MKKPIGPNLKLVVTKGPSSGHTSEFLPKFKVNVGRLVTGNKLTIKDAGISSKHLTLQFDSGSGHWTVTDLDSSNGTILNSTPLEPSTPYSVSDGDVIKFGEETVVKVEIEAIEVKDGDFSCEKSILKNVGKEGRVTRRRAAELGKLEVVEEDKELGLGFDVELGGNEKKVGRGRVKKNENVEVGKEGVIEEERELGIGVAEDLGKIEKKVGRGKVKKSLNAEIGKEGGGLENLGADEGKDVEMVSAGLRRVTRSSRRNGNDGEKNGEGIGDTGTGRVTRGGRRTRSSRIEAMSEIRGYDDRGDENLDVVEKGRRKGPPKSQKRMGNTSVENCGLGESVVEGGMIVNPEVVDGRSNRDCTMVRKKLELEVKVPESFKDGKIREEEMGEKSYLQEGDGGEGDNDGEGDRVERMQEEVCGDGSNNVQRTNLSVLGRLEKMTLGQWLDYIEDYLPKQIVAETEEMITEMRRKAERFHEFMLQQKAAKGGGDI